MAISQNFPNTPPALLLDFAKSKKLDSRITFTRGSTGTYVDDNGLIRTAGINEPRFDHDPNTLKSLGLLIEESRTNLVSYSAYDASTWSNIFPAGATITTGISAPDGTNTAVRFSCNNTTNALLRLSFPSFTPNGTDTYTTSFYVRRISGTGNAFTDLADGVPSTNYSTQLITNQWVRVVTSAVPTATSKGFIDLYSDQNTNLVLDFWGVQVEAGAFATSYIPTAGSTVTRSADNASITGTNFSSWYNSNAGSIFTQARGLTGTTFGCIVTLSGSTYQTGNGFLLRQSGSSIDRGGNSSSSSVEIASSTQFFKAACSFSGTTSDLSANGRLGNTLTTLDYTGSGTNTLNIGRLQPSGGQLYNGTISQIFYYPRRLTNTQLQNLTR